MLQQNRVNSGMAPENRNQLGSAITTKAHDADEVLF
jgi:hypothetical protein